MAKPYLSVIIPAYNEASRIPLTLIDVDMHLSQMDFPYEIIVVDDGSEDHTQEIVARFRSVLPHVALLHQAHSGKGRAVAKGMLEAQGKWRLTIDADNSIPVSEFQKIIPHISYEEPKDVVIASRGVMGTKLVPSLPARREMSEAFINTLTRLVMWSSVKDFHLGFACYSAKAATDIFSRVKLPGWGTEAEALLIAERMRFSIQEISIIGSYERHHSKVQTKAYLQMLTSLAKLRWWFLRDAYGITKQS